MPSDGHPHGLLDCGGRAPLSLEAIPANAHAADRVRTNTVGASGSSLLISSIWCELNLNFEPNFTPGELRSRENVRTYRLMGRRTLRGLRLLIYNALRNFRQRLVSRFFLVERFLQQGGRIV
jgi:hypothetical protein